MSSKLLVEGRRYERESVHTLLSCLDQAVGTLFLEAVALHPSRFLHKEIEPAGNSTLRTDG